MGLVIGLFFGWAMVKAVPDQATLTVPLGQLALPAPSWPPWPAWLAAIRPARRAATARRPVRDLHRVATAAASG